MNQTSRIVRWGFSLLVLLITTGLVYADESIYVDAAIGATSLDESIDLPIDDDATALRFGLGYDLGNNIAFEANYINLGDFEIGSTLKGEVDGGAISALFSLPMTDFITAKARVGFFSWEAEVNTPEFDSNIDGDDVFYGVGLEARLSNQFSLNGEWQRFELDDSEADVFFVGAQFRF